ncbi:uncharacterized protein RHO25_000750 [Cercospora beticola]|uniref:F-box domain-containing protein n=2 Tax=Cercospora beticola TaxID=122368 RepID=A0ABZ0N9C1_CERBT|nr:hypothetical protein RHO25_000750 [Cercospora beticola]
MASDLHTVPVRADNIAESCVARYTCGCDDFVFTQHCHSSHSSTTPPNITKRLVAFPVLEAAYMPRKDMPRRHLAPRTAPPSQVASAPRPILTLRTQIGDDGGRSDVDANAVVETDLQAILPSSAPLKVVRLDQASKHTVDGEHASVPTPRHDADSVPNPFHKLPLELMWNIALQIEDDADLCNFQLSFRDADITVKSDKFWKQRFMTKFDRPRVGSFIKGDAQFEDQYKKRREVLRNKPLFLLGNRKREIQCLAVLRDMILDSYSHRNGSSKNIHDHIVTFQHDCNLLKGIFGSNYMPRATSESDIARVNANPVMRMLQVLLAPSLLDPRPFDPENEPHIADYPRSQYMAYSSVRQQPIFIGCSGLDVNFTWTLHQLNFWRTHLLSPQEATLNYCYSLLEDHERPRFWQRQLEHAVAPCMDRKWKGAYGFVTEDEVLTIRSLSGEHEHIQDEFSGDEVHGDLQDLTLDVTEAGAESWSPVFEDILRSLAKPQRKMRTRAQKSSAMAQENPELRSFRFGGAGEDQEQNFLADGWFNSLPPQMGVPGWQRMTMMKYFIEDDTNEIDYESLWAYEGVVLPGGQIIIGRWWSPTNIIEGEAYSGPFLLWCVDQKQDTLNEDP